MTKKYIKYFLFSLLFFSTISIVYQIAVVDNPDFSIYDLGINLLSEFAGMIFTVLIFNEFLTYRQQLTNTNKFRLLYNELDELIKSIDFPFRTAANKCMIHFGEDLWNKEVIDTIREKIVLSEVDDCVFPAVPWYMIFSMQGDKILRRCENIRIQYQDILEPQISYHLFYLSNNSEMLTDLSDIKKIYENDLLLNYSRPKNLGSYFACPTDNDLKVIKKIYEWYDSSKKERERQIVNTKKYNKLITAGLLVIFMVGTVGYYRNGSYLSAGIFAVVSVMLCMVFLRLFKRKKKHSTDSKG